MRVWIGLLVVACSGCHKKADSPPAAASGSGSGSVAQTVVADAAVALPGDAAALIDAAVAVADAGALPAFCLGEGDDDVMYRQVASDDKSLTFCLDREEQPARCARLDLTSGTFTPVAGPPPEAAPKPTAPRDLSKLDLPKGHEWQTATSPDGATIAAVTDLEGKLFIVDAATGKVRKTVTWGADGGCMESPSFIGDNIYVQYNVCAGPGATGWIVTPEGKKLGGPRHVNPTGTFFPIGGTRYAFEDFTGDSVEIVDAKTGKSVKQINFNVSTMDCDDCAPFRTGNLTLVQLPGGKLVQLMTKIAVVDPVAGKLDKLIPWPKCPK